VTDRLMIPASTGDDDLLPGLLDGWLGPREGCAGPWYPVDPTDPYGAMQCEYCGPICSDDAPRIWLDARRPEVQVRVVAVLAAAGHDCLRHLHWPGLTPDISPEDSAQLLACSVALVRAGLPPVVGILPAPEPGGSGATTVFHRGPIWGPMCAWRTLPCADGFGWWFREHAGFDTGRHASGPGTGYAGRAFAEKAALDAGYALRTESGGLVLPRPEVTLLVAPVRP